MAAPSGEITALLQKMGGGDQQALEQFMQRVYGELRRLAGYYMGGERVDHTLQPTALVHEAYLRLFGRDQIDWQNHSHFVRGAARAMRRILVDHARRRARAKRAGERKESFAGGKRGHGFGPAARDTRCPGRVSSRAGIVRSPKGGGRRNALLQRHDAGGERQDLRDLRKNSKTRMEGGTGLATRRGPKGSFGMRPERWQQITRIAYAAMELKAARRADFLDEECGGDSELRQAVEGLLEDDQRVGGTIEGAIAAAAAQVQKGSVAEGAEPLLGRTISHYKVVEKLGQGGMGVVYKAEDTKLGRLVALKFLAPHLVEDQEGRQRFIHEGKAAAALDHSNICTVYEVNQEAEQTFIAMAYVEGQSVKQKIEQRPLKLDKALDIAVQTALGLKAAHQKGIVHRDIKPANLMLTEEDQVKIMDFGLAHVAAHTKLTKTGTTLGTVAYMSPEQSQAEEADRRTDVWSLGVVLYEMVTGQLPFKGDYEQAVAYNILNQDPEPITALRAGLPMELEFIVGKALAKDREERYQQVEEMIVDLRALQKKLASGKTTILGVQAALAPAQPAVAAASSGELVPKGKLRFQQALFSVTAVALLVLAFVHFRQTPPEALPAPLRRFAFTPPVPVRADRHTSNVAISPNGKHIAFAAGDAEGKLWVQDLDQQEPRAIEGTEGAEWPFWSPDDDFVAFAAGGELKKVSLQGGVAIRVCELPGSGFLRGGAWSPDGDLIVFSPSGLSKLYEVPARGGTASLLVWPEESEQSSALIRYPHFLPSEAGDRVLLFSSSAGGPGGFSVMVQDLRTGRRELLGRNIYPPVYSPSGHLVYFARQATLSTLWALPFSLETLKVTGEAFPIAHNGLGPTVATDGTLVYLDSPGTSQVQQQLVWLNRSGDKIGEIGLPQGRLGSPALSPDGRLAAVQVREGSNYDIWVWDLTRPVKTRLTTGPELDGAPVWAPTGEQVAFSSFRAGNGDIFLRQADGSGEAKVLLATPRNEYVTDWSRDGKYLLYWLDDPETGGNLWYLKRNEDGSAWEPHPFLQTPFNERAAKFSPDGRHVAYVSDESGEWEVYARPFPQGGRQSTVSSNGGAGPRWSRDGKELFYVEGSTLMAVSVSSGSTFSAGSARRLFERPPLSVGGFTSTPTYDVSADGRQFVLRERVDLGEEAPKPSIRVVQNWFEEFHDREQD